VAPAKSASKSKRSAAAAPKEKKSTAPKEVMTLYMHFLWPPGGVAGGVGAHQIR